MLIICSLYVEKKERSNHQGVLVIIYVVYKESVFGKMELTQSIYLCRFRFIFVLNVMQ